MGAFDGERLKKLVGPLRVEPGPRVSLAKDFDPRYSADFLTKEDADEDLSEGIEVLREYQERLAAQATDALLVVLQGIDAAGKDGTIEHVMSGVNPQGVSVVGFKAPSSQELRHDFLWRHQVALPERGRIGIFNRSHYEEVLVVRVHPEFLAGQHLPPEAVDAGLWERRYRQINDWERHLSENGIRVAKLFLNVSKEEQRQRFVDRIAEPEKGWKFSLADVRERERWDDYQEAYSRMLSATSTPWAPWQVIPADKKWFMRLAVAAVIIDALMAIDPRFPEVDEKMRADMAEAGRLLEAEGEAEGAGKPQGEGEHPR
ncbi:MAG TPA: polyphosphate kinase 2 family protein [Thermoleophilia bacterium]|nr:polyphosphate kinase 2 family protein [Thermoleophilia bacterium]